MATGITYDAWLLTNGLGSYSIGTSTGIPYAPEHALLTAVLRPPMRRVTCLRHLKEEIAIDNVWQTLSPTLDNEGAPVEDIGALRCEFALVSNLPVYTYVSDHFRLEKRLWMSYRSHALFIQYVLVTADDSFRLRVQPLLLLETETYANEPPAAPVKIMQNGFVATLAPKEEKHLYFTTDDKSSVIPINSWQMTYFAAASDPRDELNYIPAALTFTLAPETRITMRIGLEPADKFDAEALLQGEVERRSKHLLQLTVNNRARDRVSQVAYNSFDFLVERATQNVLNSTTILAGYPQKTDSGWCSLLALPGLLLASEEYDRARQVLEMLRSQAWKGLIPHTFAQGPTEPVYDSIDATLWYFITAFEYWEASEDLDFLDKNYSFMITMLDAHLRGTENGVRVDTADGLLLTTRETPAMTWMNRKVGDWRVNPRFGKPLEIQALWYNVLMIMQRFSEVLEKSTAQNKTRELTHLVREKMQELFWIEDAGYLADVVTEEGRDASFRANQVIAIGLPFLPFSNQQARLVLEKTRKLLVTPYGLRTLSPSHPAYRGTTGSSTEEEASAWHNGTIHPWITWPFVRASLRLGARARELYDTFKPLFTSVRRGVCGHISEAFEGDPPHKAAGCPASAVSLGAVLQSIGVLKRHQND